MTVTLVPGNTRVIYTAIQSAQGTAATTPTRKLELTEDSLDPGRSLITLPETDSSSQAPDPVVVGAEPGGTFGTWLRPNATDQLFYALLGAKSSSGSGNYTHTLTPTTVQKFLTVWDVIPGKYCTKYIDVVAKSVTVASQSLQGITSTWELRALSALMGVTEPTLPADFATDPAMTYPDVAVSRGGSHAGDVDAFSITIDRGGQYFHGDNGLAAAFYVYGLYSVTGSLTIAFQNDQEARAFNTGSTAGTALTTTQYNQALDILITDLGNSNLSVDLAVAGVIYTAFPVGIDTGGAPTTVAAAFASKRQTTLAANTIVTVKGQNADPSA